jgi:hypothetical protein
MAASPFILSGSFGLSRFLVYLVHLVDSVRPVQPNKQDKPNEPNEQVSLTAYPANRMPNLKGAYPCRRLRFFPEMCLCGSSYGRMEKGSGESKWIQH